ncbi:MAG TPA: M1 family metallopeptidase [Candidatus Saccharimonadales bacterium]|nr:M1 family metallopeptidase [Candidatus Saccharimonadales bacterium]
MSKKVRRLFLGFQPKHYNLYIDPNRDSLNLAGHITITGKKVGRPSQRLTFHQHGLKIVKAEIVKHDKKGEQTIAVSRINHHASFDEVRLHAETLLYGGEYSITLHFIGKVTEGMHGVYISRYEHNGQKKALITTQFESHHAREAFPCIDEPEAKATFDLTLVSPKGEAVLSNMPAKFQKEENGRVVTAFETTPKMSTYLLAFMYGDLQSAETTTKDGVTVRVWAVKTQTPESLQFPLEITKRGIEFFNNYYGVPYPLPKADMVAIPDFSSAAMENWGLITFREPYLLADPKTTSQSGREIIALVTIHELSHQWFGNLVTMRWWDDLWLNESFANVMEYLGSDALFPEWKLWNTFITQEGLAAIRRDSIAGVQSIKTEVRHPDEISTLFDPSIVYAKGGRLLNMLMQYVGDADFRKGLKAYFTRHAYGNTTGDDLWQALGEASGKDVASFMNPWLERSGLPVVTVDQQGKALTITQSHFLLDPQKADALRIWPLPLLASDAAIPGLLDKRELRVELASDQRVRINQGAVGHYVVRYVQPEHREAIAKQAESKQLGIAERLMLLSDSSMLSRARLQSFVETLALLNHYGQEDSEPVWDIMALIVADTRRFIDVAPKTEPAIKKLIRGLIETQYQRLGWEEKPDEPSQDTKLRATIIGLGTYAEHQAILPRALELFEAYKTDAKIVSSELRSIVFGAAVRHEAPGAFDYLLHLEETTDNVDLKQEILGALTTTKSAQRGDVLLARLKDPGKVRQHDVDRWLAYLLRNRYTRTNAWKWLRDEWPWLEKTFREDKSYDSFPRYAASAFSTRQLLEEYKAFFEPLKDQPALTRNILMGIEELENRVVWLEADLPRITSFFRQYN